MKHIYLDNSATTPIDPEVAELIKTFSLECYGNPSSVHYFGRQSRQAIEAARQQLAALLGAEPREIVFTGGGTEADNMAIQGAAKARAGKGRHLITSAIEHHAVLDTFKYLAKNGYDLTILPVDAEGLVSAQQLAAAVREDTILISVMHANNEVGSVQPIADIGKIARDKGILFHVDAVQSLGKVPIDVVKMNIDLLSVSSHKIYGPKGTGALYVRKGVRLAPTAFGGSQERKMRPGTENTAAIIGFAKACELAGQRMDEDNRKLTRLRDKLINGLLTSVRDVKLNGPTGNKRLANNVNISIAGVTGESLLLSLDALGIAASAGSACTSGSPDPSHVLLAMGLDHMTAHASLRLSLGRQNSEEEIDFVLSEFPPLVDQLRNG